MWHYWSKRNETFVEMLLECPPTLFSMSGKNSTCLLYQLCFVIGLDEISNIFQKITYGMCWNCYMVRMFLQEVWVFFSGGKGNTRWMPHQDLTNKSVGKIWSETSKTYTSNLAWMLLGECSTKCMLFIVYQSLLQP